MNRMCKYCVTFLLTLHARHGLEFPMFIEPTITWVSSGFSGYVWLDTKIVFKKNYDNLFSVEEQNLTMNKSIDH